MKALIIGGSGGLSGELAGQLTASGHEVWALTRGRRPLPSGVRSIVADREDWEAVASKLANERMTWDVVFDCICMNEIHARQDLEIVSRYTSRFIVVSTDSVYDPLHKKIPQTEEGVFLEETGSVREISYGANKRRMEKVFESAMNAGNGLKITLFRPGHIFGPGFQFGCFPEHSRQDDLLNRIVSGETLKLVGMGTYIIQPIFVGDLARVMIECVDNVRTFHEIFCIGGPQCIENRTYYEILADLLGCRVKIEEIPLEGYLEAHPEYSGHLCHRIYDLSKLKATGIGMPATSLSEGLPVKECL